MEKQQGPAVFLHDPLPYRRIGGAYRAHGVQSEPR